MIVFFAELVVKEIESAILKYTMANWTQERSVILSLLLDEVVGTEERINIIQDYCKIHDSFKNILNSCPLTTQGVGQRVL